MSANLYRMGLATILTVTGSLACLVAQETYKQRIGISNAIGRNDVRYYSMPADEGMLQQKLEEFQANERKADEYMQMARKWLAENEPSASQDQIKFLKDNIFKAELSKLNARVNQGAIEEQLRIVRDRAASRLATPAKPTLASEFAGTKWQLPNFETLWLKKSGRYETYENQPGIVSNEFGTWSESGGAISLRRDGSNSTRTLLIDNGRLKSGSQFLPKQ